VSPATAIIRPPQTDKKATKQTDAESACNPLQRQAVFEQLLATSKIAVFLAELGD
jgi:putative Ca2+/H+ antiporter (TMEM165/GDT1 family)